MQLPCHAQEQGAKQLERSRGARSSARLLLGRRADRAFVTQSLLRSTLRSKLCAGSQHVRHRKFLCNAEVTILLPTRGREAVPRREKSPPTDIKPTKAER